MIRKATASDINGIVELVKSNPDTLLPRSTKEIQDLLEWFWVADEGGKVIGCCCLEIYSPKIAEVRTLAVAADHQGSGLGRALVESAVADAEKRNIREVLVVTSALKFFEKLNFGPCLHEKYALFWKGK
jgi:N-acetylglutamate synthase-like GNAT family acetyltransferase